MNRFLYAAAAFAVALPLYALRPGDPADELDVKWLQGTAVALLPPANPQPNQTAYKAAVFLLTRAANREETLLLLDQLRREYAGFVRIAAITPDAEADAKALLDAAGMPSLPFGVDTQRKLTAKYMNGSLLYPMAFLIDDKGVVIWNGEAIDLGETLQKLKNGTFQAKREKQIAPLLDELQSLLRDGNDRRMKQVSDAILKLEPGHPTALRIRLFVCENSNRAVEAWELVTRELTKAPQLERLYFMALDLAARHPELASRAAGTARDYFAAVPSRPDSDSLMGWTLLNRFPMDPEVLRVAAQLIGRAVAGTPTDAPPARQGALLNARALLAARLGHLDRAAELQKQSVAMWKQTELSGALREAEARAVYFETAKALSTSVK